MFKYYKQLFTCFLYSGFSSLEGPGGNQDNEDKPKLKTQELIEEHKADGKLSTMEIIEITSEMEREKDLITDATRNELKESILKIVRESFSDKVGEFQNEAFGSGVKSVDFDEEGVFFDHDALSNVGLVKLMNTFNLSQDVIIKELNKDRNLKQEVIVNQTSEADNIFVTESSEEEKSELDKLLDKRNDLLSLKGRDAYPIPMNKVGAEALLHFTEVSESLQGDLISNYNALSEFVFLKKINTTDNYNALDGFNIFHDNQGILENQISALELSLSAYDVNIRSLNNEAQINNIPDPIINKTLEKSEIITNFSEVVRSVNPCKGVEIKLVDGVCHLKYTKTGNTTQFNLSETDNAKYLTVEGLKGLVEKKLTQWNKTPEVKPEQDNKQATQSEGNNENSDKSIVDNVVENVSSGIDYIVEKTKDLIQWADELVDGKKIGKFTGANGEEVKIQCDGTQLSIDTSWFGDDVMDYNITQSLNDIIDNKTGEPVEKSIQKLIEQYNQKVLEEAYDDINKKSRTSDVVDTVTNTDGETEKVYLKRRDSRDGEINIFIQIGDTKTKVELSEDNTYTHSDVKNKIKEAKDNYNKEVSKNTKKIKEVAKNQEEKLGNINKEILALDINDSVTELLNHKVGNKNFKTIELGTVDKGGDNIDVALRKYPDGSYRVMIDPDGFGNGESVKLQKEKFNKTSVETTINTLVAEFRMKK